MSKEKGIGLAVIGVVLILLREVPLVTKNILGTDISYSLSQASNVCSSMLGGIIPECGWVTPLNWLLILLGVLFIGAGIYFLYQHYNKK